MSNDTNRKSYTIPRKFIRDTRGWFLKVMDGNEQGNPFPCEVYFTSAKPGECKGGHYHPLANEWFTLIQGEATVRLTSVESQESWSVNLTGDAPETIFVPSGLAHVFINTGDRDFLLLGFTDTQYRAEDTIPYPF